MTSVTRVFLYPEIVQRRTGDIDIPKEELIRTRSGGHVLVKSVNIIDSIHPSWHPLLLERGLRINERLKRMYITGFAEGFEVRPNAEDVFNVFGTPLHSVKAVVVGQDPYPGWDVKRKKPVASGYSFATMDINTPGSLQRIQMSIVDKFGKLSITDKEHPNSLRGWIDQGVLLLNNIPVLLIPPTDAESSKQLSSLVSTPTTVWTGITAEICKEIMSVNKQCPFILVGKSAQGLERCVSRSICTNHPSMRSDQEFTGLCFTQVPEIDWNKM
jgi:uracil-DNA glycosylase